MRNLLVVIVLCGLLYWFYVDYFGKKEVSSIENLKRNYEKEIDTLCQAMDLPAEFFKALVILESSAEKPSGTRFEPHIFEKLKAVRNGDIKNYGKFTEKQLQILTENTLKKMATSWGPIQILGYHCIPMGITLEQLTGEEAMRYAIQFADKSYGKYLRKRDFINAFHIHNTGKPMPKSGKPETYDPEYISKGMEYVSFFKKR